MTEISHMISAISSMVASSLALNICLALLMVYSFILFYRKEIYFKVEKNNARFDD